MFKRFAVVALLLGLFMAPSAKASIVLDDFSLNTFDGVSAVVATFNINRTVTGPGSLFLGGGNSIQSDGDFSVAYDFSGQTVNSLFAASGFSWPTNGFAFNVGNIFGGNYNISANWGTGSVSFTNVTSQSDFVVQDFSFGDATGIVFDFTKNSGGGFQFGSGDFVATPEPTSMAMFGLLAGCGYFGRKRLRAKK